MGRIEYACSCCFGMTVNTIAKFDLIKLIVSPWNRVRYGYYLCGWVFPIVNVLLHFLEVR